MTDELKTAKIKLDQMIAQKDKQELVLMKIKYEISEQKNKIAKMKLDAIEEAQKKLHEQNDEQIDKQPDKQSDEQSDRQENEEVQKKRQDVNIQPNSDIQIINKKRIKKYRPVSELVDF